MFEQLKHWRFSVCLLFLKSTFIQIYRQYVYAYFTKYEDINKIIIYMYQKYKI